MTRPRLLGVGAACLAVVIVVLGELGSPLPPALVVLDGAAGGVLLVTGAVAAGDRSAVRFAASAGAAGVLWFLANHVDALVFAWRPAMVLAVLAAATRRLHRLDVCVVLLFAVAAAVPRSGADPWITVALGVLLVVVAAVRLRRPRAGSSSGWATIAAAALAVGLAIPAVAALRSLPPSTGGAFTAVHSGLVAISGGALLVVALRRRYRTRLLVDSVIELSGRADPALLDETRLPDIEPVDARTEVLVLEARSMVAEHRRLQGEMQERIIQVQDSRRRLLQAADVERAGIEQRLVQRVGPLLDDLEEQFARLLDAAPAEAADDVGRCAEEVGHLRADLASLVRGLPPRLLAAHGLRAALQDLAARAAVDVDLDVRVDRLPEPVERAVWFACAECMANVGKHAAAAHVRIEVLRSVDEVVFTVTDDGRGGASLSDGGGLIGLVDRLGVLGGGLEVESSERGTRVRGWVPCEAS